MNLNKQLELADAIFGRDPQTGLERVTATAVSDSADGSVTVEFDDGTTADVPVTGAVKDGDEVIVNVQNGTPVAAGSAGWGDRVQTIAEDAQAVAEATGQHFWHRSDNPDGAGAGAFITDTEQDDFLDAAADSFSDYDPDTKPYANMLLNSLGVLIRNALHTFASFTKDAVRFYNEDDEQVAEFGTNGAVIGRDGDGVTRLELNANGVDLIVGDSYGHPLNPASIHRNAFTFGARIDDTQVGYFSFVEGNGAAFGDRAHAEGGGTYAKGDASHSQNYYTIAGSDYQTAMGRYNIEDAADAYALIIGNGTAYNARSNAFTVAWNGDIVASGEVTDGNNNTLSGKQDALVSGTNIKTINNESLLGSGNITIQGGGSTTTWYGTSSTAASTQTKAVTCADFTLKKGALLLVQFTNRNTYGSLKLNVNNTGAINVYHRSAVTSSSNFVTWSSKAYCLFQYDGTYWVFITSSDSRIVCSKDRQNSANIGIWGTGAVDHLICKATTMTTGTPASDGHILDMDWDASYPQHVQLFLPCVAGEFPSWRMQTGNTTWGAWDTFYTVANPPTGAGFVSFKRFVPDSGASAQTLGTSVQALTNMGSSDGGNADVSHVSTGTYKINAAGTWRVRVKLGMYPNSTAATRLCAGIYDTSVSGTRLSLGVQAVDNLTANTPSKVVTVECDYIGTFNANDVVAIGAFADVTNAKVYKGGGDLTCVVFEKVG